MYVLSRYLTEPIVQLTEKIQVNIRSVNELKQDHTATQQNKQISF